MRTIAVVTGGRSDYGIYLPVLQAIRRDRGLRLQLLVTGTHLSPEFGLTEREIRGDGFRIAERIEMLVSSDTPQGVAKSMGLGVLGFAQRFARERPDILLVLGDRFEMYAAAVAGLPYGIPIAHIHGGEVTAGAIDEALRHSLTKLSHLHFVSCQGHARRVRQLGEESWRITVSGAPGLDAFRNLRLLSLAELETAHHLRLAPAPLLVTFHPATAGGARPAQEAVELLAALARSGLPCVITMPNSDAGGRAIRARIESFVRRRKNAWAVENLGTRAYASLMAVSAAMVGNSSSGLIEAPEFSLPVVNIGRRQEGRTRAANVLDVEPSRGAILRGIERAVAPAFRASLAGMKNPYGTGHAAEIIVDRLKQVKLDIALTAKRFCDQTAAAPAGETI